MSRWICRVQRRQLPRQRTPQNGEFDVTIDFGENVRDFTRSDVVVRNATKASSWKSQTESLYVLTLTPTIADGSTGTVTIDVNAGVAEDTGSNPNVGGIASDGKH